MKKEIWILVFFNIVSIVFGQNKMITGTITDSNQNKLNGATVTLLQKETNDALKVTFSDSLGYFELPILSNDSINILITFIGFNNFLHKYSIPKNNSENFSIGEIILYDNIQQVNEITIATQRQFVVKKMDRIIVYPDALISNAGQNLNSVIEKAPGIQLDMNGNITYKGKSGFQVFINSKPTYLNGQELMNYLKSTSSSIVERIELMDNPPAKFDAAGNAGIINLILKKANIRGYSIGINLSYGQGIHSRSNNSLNFNYLRNKLTILSSIGYTINNSQQDLTIKRNYYNDFGYPTSSFIQNSIISPKNKGLNARIGIDYQLDKKTSLGVTWNGFNNPSNRNTINKSDITNESGLPIKKILAEIPTNINFNNNSFNFNISRKFGKSGNELNLNFDILNYKMQIHQVLDNKIYNILDTLMNNYTTLTSNLPSNINIQSIKLDYNHFLNNGGKIEVGTKISGIKAKNIADFSDVVNGQLVPNYIFSNNFNYNENINAAYVNHSREFSKFSYQIGLRVENTIIDGFQFGNPFFKDSTIKRNYTNLFPTLFLQYNLDSLKQHVLGFTFGRRIDRPAYKDMNPFTYPLDNYTLYGGNPFLRPTFSYNTEFSYTLYNNWNFALEYNIIKDVINETNEQKGSTWYSRPGNFEEQKDFGFSISGTQLIMKGWNIQFYGAINNVSFKSKIYSENLDASRWYTIITPTNLFNFGKNWSGELAGSFQSKILSGQFTIDPIWSVRLGIAKKVLNQKGTIKLNISDIFYTNQVAGEIRNIKNATANWFSYLDSRVATISFSYQFNKGEKLKTRKVGGADLEKSRVKI